MKLVWKPSPPLTLRWAFISYFIYHFMWKITPAPLSSIVVPTIPVYVELLLEMDRFLYVLYAGWLEKLIRYISISCVIIFSTEKKWTIYCIRFK